RVAALAGIAHVYADEANKPEEGRKMLERAFHLALTVPTTDERVQALLYVLEHRNCTQHNELAQRAYQELLKTAGKISSTEERDGVYRMLIDTLIDIGFYEEASQTLQRLSRRSERAFKLAEVAQAEHHCNPESARARLSKAREIVMELIQKRDFRDMFALVGVVRIHVQMGETSLVNPAIQQLWSQIDTLQEVETFTQSKRLNFEGQQVMQLMLAAGKADEVAAWYTKQVEAQKDAELRTQWATQGVEFLVKAGYWEEAQPLLQKIHPPVRRDETLHRLLYALLEESDPESSSDEPWEFRFPLSPEQREKLIEQILNRIQGNRIRAEARQTLIERLINQKQFEKAWQMAAALSGEHRDITQQEILSRMISENMHEQAERYVQSRPMRQQIDFWFSVARHNLSQGNRNAAIQALNRITNLISQNSAPEQERFMSWESLAFLQAELGLIEECLKSVRRIEFPEYRADLLIRIAFLLVGDRREARVY
ncbi:MAG: hypothetical protein NZM28_01575, partial [Fimbriimonadales bacterium]|nr:hypothetical protein [Fimbriimonadales bacterium]